jgi:hypothetical protein
MHFRGTVKLLQLRVEIQYQLLGVYLLSSVGLTLHPSLMFILSVTLFISSLLPEALNLCVPPSSTGFLHGIRALIQRLLPLSVSC